MTVKAYPYIRFSTDDQEDGDSIARQTRATNQLAAATGLPVAKAIVDKGMSGYHGDHRKKGELGKFLASVKAGKVASGSVLVVENADRLSREGFLSVLRYVIFPLDSAGISVVTESGPIKANDSGDDPMNQLLMVLENSRARGESARRSKMLKSARQSEVDMAREDGRPLTTNCPNWLVVVGDTGKGKRCQMKRSFKVKPKAKKTLRLIFKWYLDGLTVGAIEKKLNGRRDVWVPQRFETQKTVGWRKSYITKLLGYQTLTGHFQPHTGRGNKRKPNGEPIEGYFPQIIEDDLWHAVQAKRAKTPKNPGGRTGKNSNLFTHLIKCGYCEGPMRIENKGNGPKGGKRYACSNDVTGIGCKRVGPHKHAIRHSEVEDLVLHNCQHLDPAEILPHRGKMEMATKEIANRVEALTGRLADLQRRINNTTDAIGDADSVGVRDRLKAKLDTLAEEESQAQAELKEKQAEYAKQSTAATDLAQWRADFEGLLKALDSPEIRRLAKQHLRSLIEKIEVFAIGETTELPSQTIKALWEPMPIPAATSKLAAGIAQVMGYLRTAKPIKPGRLREFEACLIKRLQTKDNRFIRIHYKTGAVVDVVPYDSLAIGRRLAGKARQWVMHYPDLNVFWSRFTKGNYKA